MFVRMDGCVYAYIDPSSTPSLSLISVVCTCIHFSLSLSLSLDLDLRVAFFFPPSFVRSCLVVKPFHRRSDLLVTAGKYSMSVWRLDKANRKLYPLEAKMGQLKRVIKSLAITEDDESAYCGTRFENFLRACPCSFAKLCTFRNFSFLVLYYDESVYSETRSDIFVRASPWTTAIVQVVFSTYVYHFERVSMYVYMKGESWNLLWDSSTAVFS